MPRFARPRMGLALGVLGAWLSSAGPALAFERQWHFGGGLGAAAPNGGYSLGPVLGLHAAYGISDVFDARLELQGSTHDLDGLAVSFYGAKAGLAYKLDVIQWIPYAGVSAGEYAIVWNEGTLFRPCVGALVGLDYAFSRHFGMGVVGSGDYVFSDPQVTVFSGLFRAEYRFGW
ncbi:MAG TPA: hypothetical protein VF103_00685 [Polyangiaceae bacterium]